MAERSKLSPGYSLRGFADKLGVSNSYLSEILKGKKALSVELAFKLAVKLKLTDQETQYFCLLVQLEHEADPEFRAELMRRLEAANPQRKSHDLSVDIFKAISDWYHLAILELTFLPNFRFDASHIAKELGISKNEAELAMERLMRLELIQKNPKNRKLRKSKGYTLTESHIPNSALKIFHKQILQKSIQAIDAQGPKERVTANDILPFDSKNLPEMDRLSREFSAAAIRIANRSKCKDSVYALSVNFFRLSTGERNE